MSASNSSAWNNATGHTARSGRWVDEDEEREGETKRGRAVVMTMVTMIAVVMRW